MNYKAEYTLQINSEHLEFEFSQEKGSNLRLLQVSRLTPEGIAPATFRITLSFSAANSQEANRMAAINTDSSVLVFSENTVPVNYHVTISKQQLLWEKVIIKQLVSCESLSAYGLQSQNEPKPMLRQTQ